MRSEGKPILVSGDVSTELERIRIGGKESAQDERWLQELIQRHPECIPMDQIEPGLSRLVPICMELALPSGYVDNLLMSPEGDIVIVETKLWRNPEARREVVAQALDYASSLFKINYGELEKLILKAKVDDMPRPERLYDLFDEADRLDEPDFVDAVNTNLRNGRIVVLVIGDGIRTEVEDLVSGLQSHAGFHFTFALVELAVFQGAEDDEFLIVPRTLAKTYMIERGIVRIDDQRSEVVGVSAPSKQKVAAGGFRQSITSEQFFESMKEHHPDLPKQLQSFIDNLAALGVYPEFKRSLILRWDSPEGRPVNLGYIMRDGKLWTDTIGPSPSQRITRTYKDDLAKAFGGEVFETAKTAYVAVDGKAPFIEGIMDNMDAWYEVIEQFQNRIRDHITENEGEA